MMYFDFFDIILFILLFFSCLFLTGFIIAKQKERNSLKNIVLKANLEQQKLLFPTKVKAIERFALFIERLKIENLSQRIKPISEVTELYKLLLIATIEQEFNHNAVQHIYISEASYQSVVNAKNVTISHIELSAKENPNSLTDFREALIKPSSDLPLSISSSLLSLKRELSSL
ncbi:MAG: hypothetical protein HQ471_01270 [Flavobacteriales bacterium]|nr:hypothetical protein [Flavobacteriales bacterium]